MKILLFALVLVAALGVSLMIGLRIPIGTTWEIGSIRLSPVDLAIGIGLFFLIVALTRRLQVMLDKRVLPKSGIEPGLSQSIVAVTGYAGVALAVVAGVSAAGINLSSFAVVAGALSVGIGFGLQNIVNNFVSGLILLFERPVKSGDWVVVGPNEGLIKRINVRSTEIETFNLASVIVPNADLISHPVTNWTHKDRRGRIELKVQVSPESDPRLVHDLLRDVAGGHAHVVADPEPAVIFAEILPAGFDFILLCYTDDVLLRGQIASELRFLIIDAFNAHDVKLSPPAAGAPSGPNIRPAAAL